MKAELQLEFWNKFLAQAKPNIKAFQNISSIKRRDLKTRTGIRSTQFILTIGNSFVRAELSIYKSDKEENKSIYRELLKQKNILETNFGNKLFWHNLENNDHARIGHSIEIDSLNRKTGKK